MVKKNSYINKGTMEQKEFVDAMFTNGGIEKVMTTNEDRTLEEDFEENTL